ncbi:hypothetical protein ABEB36_013614 [Hypothenemus hampei]|uniref:BESS domain-containing protein n=1 Tax=Hypothenemus hampei TaxID=57062 RepID=A0ABD1E4S5_HYPHA
MYTRQLGFLKGSITARKTISSLESESIASTSAQREDEEEHKDDEEELLSPTPCSSGTNILRASRTQVGKKNLHPFEKRLLYSLDRYEKKENVADDDNRQFLLSLIPSLSSLPKNLNTNCRIELMQCISKYEAMCQPFQQTTYQHQPIARSSSYIVNQLQYASQQYSPRTFATPVTTPSPSSPAESIVFYHTNSLSDENDLQLSQLINN